MSDVIGVVLSTPMQSDDEDMAVHQPAFPRPQYVSMINANDISSDDDTFPVQPKTPAIAPLRFENTRSQPLKRRFFSTGGNQKQREQIGQPLQRLDSKNQELNQLVFGVKKEAPDQDAAYKSYQAYSPIRQAQNKLILSQSTREVSQTLQQEISNSNALQNRSQMAQKRLQRSRKPSAAPEPLKAIVSSQPRLPSTQQAIEQASLLLDDAPSDEQPNAYADAQKRQAQRELAQRQLQKQPTPAPAKSAVEEQFILASRASQVNLTNQPPVHKTKMFVRKEKTPVAPESFKYNESMQSRPDFSSLEQTFNQALIQSTQNDIKQQFIQVQKPVARVQQPQVPTQKMYTASVLQDVFNNLDSKQDWAVRDRALKEIQQIAFNQAHLISNFGPFFAQIPKLLVDLRSALVTQTLDTLEAVYTNYRNSAVLLDQQQFLVNLFKKAGSPSLADFMAQATDRTVLAGVTQLLTSLSFQQGQLNLFLQNLQTEVRVTNAPGLKWRCFYLLGDLHAIAYFDQLPTVSGSVMQAFQIEWCGAGLQAPCEWFALESGVGLDVVQTKLKRSLMGCQQFCLEAIKKLQTDPNPEVRRAIRRLYCLLRQLGLIKERFQKMDELLEREGVVQSWFGRQ